ncbi:ABC transporter permease [Dactylosporangium sp. CA-233914]|uniref:ABC transporter permease n=1 Tax=Dactylosporangium sp. CA-233914 TaxID=3239934 RepID=UPI003D91C8F5
MYTTVLNSLDQGLITAFMALGVLITFQLMGFPDMTVEGSYMLGGVVSATLLVAGHGPITATAGGMAAGALAGLCTGVMHTKLGINAIIAGLLTTSAAFTVALVVMGRPNASLLSVEGFYDYVPRVLHLPVGGWSRIATTAVLIGVVAAILYWFLNTNLGITIRAVGSNERMIRALSVDTDFIKILAMTISNALVAIAGALATQAQGFADVNMGLGALVAAFASLVVGQTLLRSRKLAIWILAVLVGAVLYRMLLNVALRTGLPPDYFKLLTAGLVLVALWGPSYLGSLRGRRQIVREEKKLNTRKPKPLQEAQ